MWRFYEGLCLTFLSNAFISIRGRCSIWGFISVAQNPAQPPEPTPPTNKPDMPDTTLVGTKKQTKEAKRKAHKQMKEKEKEMNSEGK